MKTNPNFEKTSIYPELSIIRDSDTKRVVAYVHKHPYEKYWFWFVGSKISPSMYENEQYCIEDAIREYFLYNMDLKAKKAGTFNNEDLTLGR